MPRIKIATRDRFPSGRAKPDNSDPVTRIRSIIAAARKQAPILGTPIGRLHFEGFLTVTDVAAADHFLLTRARYDVVMGLPSPNAQSMAYGAVRAGYRGDGDTKSIDRARRNWERLTGLYERPVGDLLHRVIVCGMEPAWIERTGLKYGLAAIAISMGLTRPGKSERLQK